MEDERHAADETGDGAEEGDAPLAEVVVDQVVEEGGQEVADAGGEEEERDEGVGDGVVGADLREVSFWVSLGTGGGRG